MVRDKTSPAWIVSDPIAPAFVKLDENPKEGLTPVAAFTRSVTATTKESPSSSTDPEKISFLVGPDLGSPHAERLATIQNTAVARRVRDLISFTARSPLSRYSARILQISLLKLGMKI
jgi:hypothetical protein